MRKGDNDRAIADFNEAIRLDPKSSLTFRNRGDAYTDKGDHDRALADYSEAIRLDPKALLPSATVASLMGIKATTTEPSPI